VPINRHCQSKCKKSCHTTRAIPALCAGAACTGTHRSTLVHCSVGLLQVTATGCLPWRSLALHWMLDRLMSSDRPIVNFRDAERSPLSTRGSSGNCRLSMDFVLYRSTLPCNLAALLQRLASQSINITPSLARFIRGQGASSA